MLFFFLFWASCVSDASQTLDALLTCKIKKKRPRTADQSITRTLEQTSQEGFLINLHKLLQSTNYLFFIVHLTVSSPPFLCA